jgi:DNA-binding transcriptional regulator YhcF (GntR family)
LKLISEGRRGDQSELIFAICLGAAAVGFDFTKLFRLLEDPAHGGGLRLRQEIEVHGPERAIEWFAITWEAAQRHRASQLAMIDQLKEEAAHYEWPRTVRYRARLGAFHQVRSRSMELVLDAALQLAAQYTTTEPMLSQRLIAQMTKKDAKTVRNALGGLEVLGWLERERQTGVFGPDIYRLLLDPEIREIRLSSPALAEGTFDLLLGPDTETPGDPPTPLIAL